MFPTLAPANYQEVRKTLTWFASGLMFMATVGASLFIVPSEHRAALEFVSRELPGWFLSSVGPGLVFGAAAALLIGVLDVHDKVYDSWVIRWRHRYDIDVVLPALLRPFAGRIHPRFWKVAETNRREFMARLFYPLVADRGGVLSENARIRFWERAVKYWMTQITEMAVLLLTLLTFGYAPVYEELGLEMNNLMGLLAALLAVFVANRWFRRKALVSLRNATLEEIDEIHEGHLGRLEDSLTKLHHHYNLGPLAA